MTAWLTAIRPRTLPASVAPVLVANSLSWGDYFSPLIAVCTLLTALLLQIAVNLANDYFDFRSGVDTEDRLGPVRATQAGLITPEKMLKAVILALILATFSAAYLIWRGGLPILLLTLASIIGVLWYSGGRYSLASLGLGEVTVFLFFGWAAVLGTQYLHLGYVNLNGWWLATQMGLISAAIMLVNNIRDIDTDRAAEKKTLAVRIGDTSARKLYTALLIIPYLMQTLQFLSGPQSAGYLLPFLTVPWLIKLVKAMPVTRGQALNNLLANTAMLLLIFGLTESVGLIILTENAL